LTQGHFDSATNNGPPLIQKKLRSTNWWRQINVKPDMHWRQSRMSKRLSTFRRQKSIAYVGRTGDKVETSWILMTAQICA